MSFSRTFEIDFEPVGKRVEVEAETNLFEAARQAGIDLASACGSVGNCGQCRVVVIKGDVSPPTEDEDYILTEAELHSGQRLACCTHIQSNIKVHIPNSSLITEQRLQIEGDSVPLSLDPVILAHDIELSPPTLHDPRSDLERLVAALNLNQSEIVAEPAVVRQISPFAREHRWQITVFRRQSEIVGLAPAGSHPLGFAVDLGTTKLAYQLPLAPPPEERPPPKSSLSQSLPEEFEEPHLSSSKESYKGSGGGDSFGNTAISSSR